MIIPICPEMPLSKPLKPKEYRMKLRSRSLCVLACTALFMTVIFSSCGDSGNPVGAASSSPVGSWNLTSATVGGVSTPVGTSTLTMVMTFGSNFTYTNTTILYMVDPPETSVEQGTWSTSGNKLITTPTGSSESDTVTYSISGNSLTATDVDNSSGSPVSTVMVFTKS
jgi:hypothetical protein